MGSNVNHTIFLIPITLVIGMLFYSCENDLEEVQRVTTYSSLPLQTILNAKITYTDSARVRFIVEAGKIDRYPQLERPTDEFSSGVKVLTYNADGEITSELTAERASNFTEDKLMIARDSVILRNNEGRVLNTEELTWNEVEGTVYTDKFVKITTPTEILYGDGLKAKQDFTEYEIINIKGRITVDGMEDSTQTNN